MSDNGTPKPPPMCPILTGALTTAHAIASASQREREMSKIIDPFQKAAASQISLNIQGVPCQGKLCGFWYEMGEKGEGKCGIAASPGIMDVIGGTLFDKLLNKPA